MINNDEDEIEEDAYNNPKIGSGELLAFGSFNLTLTLNLEQSDLTKYKLEWDDIKPLKDLKFIRKHHHFWKRVELSSNNETLKIILNINKTSPKLIHIGYVVFKKINFKNEQIDFQKFLFGILRKRGFFITSCDICDCSINIQLLLKYGNEEKSFLLAEESKGNKKSEIKSKKIFEEDQNGDNLDKKKSEEEKEKSDNPDNSNNSNTNKEEQENSDNKTKSNEEDSKSEYNPFINLHKNDINYGNFDYIYFNFNDYIEGEFKGKIKLENLFEYFQDIKIRTRTKIILNFEEEIEIFRNKNKEEIFKDLLSITDFFIFYDINKLYEVLKELKEVEDQEIIDESYRIQCFRVQKKIIERKKMKEKEEIWAKSYKKFLEKSKDKKSAMQNPKSLKNFLTNKTPVNKIYITQEVTNNTESIDPNDIINSTENNNQETVENTNNSMIQNNQIKTEVTTNYNFKDLIYHKSKSETVKYNNLLPIKPSGPKPLNKNDMFMYLKNSILNRDPQKKPSEKIIIVLDEFNKIYIVKCVKFYKKPIVMDFDLKLYPPMNIRNMKDILNYKKFIKSKFNEYISIFIGSLLGVLVSRFDEYSYQEGYLFIAYLIAINIIKKISEIQRLNLPLPKDKEFYYPSLNREEVDKLMIEIEQKRKERGFILDGTDRAIKKLKFYNPLLDKNLSSYLNSKNNKNILQSNGVIGKDGKIIYDPTYRDTLGFNTLRNKKHNFLFNSDTKRKNKKNDFKSLANETNKLMVGFKKKKAGYEVYKTKKKNLNENKIILPEIKRNRVIPLKKGFKTEKEKIIIEKSEESGSVGENDNDNDNEDKGDKTENAKSNEGSNDE